MPDITQILNAIDAGDPQAANQLLPLVYDELRKLATVKMAQERPDHSLDATALVHEAYLRLVGDQRFDNRDHFFAAAAEAMRRILIESARRNASLRHGGVHERRDVSDSSLVAPEMSDELLALDEALSLLAQADAEAAELVKLRYFAGLTAAQAADAIGISLRSAERMWTFARSWLFRKLSS
jgi:RNA polymerase sigma factor (TIGR02999 family)